MITIKKRIIDAIYRHAISAYPSECCGIITGKKNVGAIHESPLLLENSFPCRNLQDELHTENPEKFPRTSKTAYFLDPKDLFNIEKVARTKNEVVRVIYHSHVDVGAYFSEEDKKQAMYPAEVGAIHESPLLYPDVNYLVVDVTKDSVRGSKLFGWDSSKKDFIELDWQST